MMTFTKPCASSSFPRFENGEVYERQSHGAAIMSQLQDETTLMRSLSPRIIFSEKRNRQSNYVDTVSPSFTQRRGSYTRVCLIRCIKEGARSFFVGFHHGRLFALPCCKAFYGIRDKENMSPRACRYVCVDNWQFPLLFPRLQNNKSDFTACNLASFYFTCEYKIVS